VNKLITVLIVSWNRRHHLLDALASVRTQTYQPLEMLVVDSGSTDGTGEAVQAAFPEARVVRLERNLGCPAARNVGIHHAAGDCVFFLDSDAVLDRRAVEFAYRRLCEPDHPAVVSARVVDQVSGREVCPTRRGLKDPRQRMFTPTFSGGASLHRAALFTEVGPFPEDFIYACEETHLALRLLDRGYLMAYEPASVVHHRCAPAGRDVDSNMVRSWENSLATAWELYPLEVALHATLRSLVVQPIRAARSHALRLWVRSTVRRTARVAEVCRRGRRPVRRRTLRIAHLLHRQVVADAALVRGLCDAQVRLPAWSLVDFLLFFR
jgi:GT2 family glycosyltransferase